MIYFTHKRFLLLSSLLILFSLSGIQAFASSKDARFGTAEQNLEESLEQKVQHVLREYDPKALIFVQVEYKRAESVLLPSTPFMVRGLTVSNPNLRTPVDRIQIRIYSQKSAPLPASILSLIEECGRQLGAKPTVQLSLLPPELNGKDEAPGSKASLDISKVVENPWIQAFQIFVVSACGLFGVLLCLNGYLARRQNKILFGQFESQWKQSFEALQSQPIDSRSSVKEVQTPSALSLSSPSRDPLRDQGSKPRDIRLPSAGLRALFMDCYWSKLDGYAAFLWENIPSEQRRELSESSSLLREYAGFISDLPTLDLGHDRDPAYLSPLSIEQFDPEAIAVAAKREPGLMKVLSRIRIESLPLTVSERIEIQSLSESAAGLSRPLEEVLLGLTAGKLRRLSRKINLVIQSLEEERQLLARTQLSSAVKASIPSLGWGVQISEGALAKILKAYSAQELATAWIGPEEILTKLEAALPERKRALMKAYLATIQPTRQSRVFIELHDQIIHALGSDEAAA